jgi:hypothetical protein
MNAQQTQSPPYQYVNNPIQDVAAVGGLLVPLVVAVGFFFTMRAKLEELDKSIRLQGEMTLLKIENRFISLSEKISNFHEDLVRQEHEVKELKLEVERQKEAKHDILKQLSAMGIDLYVIGENDRRHRTSE